MHQIRSLTLLVAFLMLPAGGSRAEWTKMCHPGSDIRSLAFSGTALYAVGSKNRMYRTTDFGLSWTQVNLIGTRATPNRAYNSLAFYSECVLLGASHGEICQGKSDGSNWSTIWIGGNDDILASGRSQGKTGVTFLAGGLGNGIRVSSDSGKTWISSNTGLTNLNVTSFGSGRSLPDSSGQVLFVGTYGDGVFVSCDNGQTWSPTGQSPCASNITSLHVDGEYLVITGSGGKVCSSSDGGNSWQDVGAGLPYTELLCLTILNDTTDDWFYCGTVDEGVWRCPSSGGQWTPCNSGLMSFRINTIISEGGTLYVGTNEGIYRSADGGASWTAIGDGTMPRLTAIHAQSTLGSNSKDLLVAGTDKTYAATPMYAPSSSTFSTTDGGTNWITASALFEGQVLSITHRDDLQFLLSEGSTYHCGGLNVSSDMGETWELPVCSTPFPFACMEIAQRKDKSRLDCYLGATWGSLTGVQFSSDTGRTWGTITNTPTYSMGSVDSFLIVVGSQGVLRTSDYGTTWQDITVNLGGHTVTSFSDDGERLFAYGSGGVVVTSDGGNTWLPAGLAGKAVTSLAPIDSCLLAVADGRIYAATRETFDWSDVTDELAVVPAGRITASSQTCYVLQSDGKGLWKRPISELLQIMQTRALAPALVYPPNDSNVYSDTVTLLWNQSARASGYHVQLSADTQFVSCTVNDSSVVDTLRPVAGLTNGTTYYWRVRGRNVSGFGLWGSTWHFSTIVLPPSAVQLTSPAHGAIVSVDSVLFVWRRAAGSGIIYAFELSTDSLFTIATVDSSIVDTTRLEKGLLKGARYWWRVRARNAAGWGSYSSPNRVEISLTSVESQSQIPKVFSLAQNYPNPFNPSTTIQYALPHRAHVALTIWSTLGQIVREVVNGDIDAGYHEVKFDATGLASGIYFYRMEASRSPKDVGGQASTSSAGSLQSFVETRKLLLLR